MDRWGGADDDDADYTKQKQMGRVARLGMAGFVKPQGDSGGDDGRGFGAGPQGKVQGIEIVASKKDQKQQAIAQSQANLPSRPAAPPPGPPPPKPPDLPDWVGSSMPSGAYIKVMKDGQCIQRIELVKGATIFGRSPQADVLLEHASISRSHAALCARKDSSRVFLLDFGSAHGTWLNNSRVGKGCPVEVVPGATLKFGASTRNYVFDVQAKPSRKPEDEEEGAPARKRGRVRFMDEEAEGGLEEVLGYSDGSSFQPMVGPKQATTGLFANYTPSTTTPDAAPRTSSGSPAAAAGGPGSGAGGSQVKPQLQAFIQELKSKPKGLYDHLP